MDFSELIAPVPVDRFMAEHYGRRPLHIPASEESGRRALIGWPRLNALLGQQLHWSEAHIRLLMNGRAVAPDLYMEEVDTLEGPVRRASLARVDAYLAMGASLLGGAVHQISAEIRAASDALAERFGGAASANVYCSFAGVQAFPTHFDSHEVFAVHGEGEKVWRIYENRSEIPLDTAIPKAVMQARIDAARGAVMLEARMRPGDLLYIPRGFYHDALASSREALHLTLTVKPRTARALFRLLDEAARHDPLLNAYLPDARDGNEAALAERLDSLADHVARQIRSPAFLAEVANDQRKPVRPAYRPDLPNRPELRSYARTSAPARVERREAGAVLCVDGPGGGEFALGALAEETEWMLARLLFSTQELAAQFPHRRRDELAGLVARVEQWGLFRPCEPRAAVSPGA